MTYHSLHLTFPFSLMMIMYASFLFHLHVVMIPVVYIHVCFLSRLLVTQLNMRFFLLFLLHRIIMLMMTQVISGQYVCPDTNTASPQVEVELIGIPVDCNKQRTKIIQRNSSNPFFNDTFLFRVRN